MENSSAYEKYQYEDLGFDALNQLFLRGSNSILIFKNLR